MHKRLFSTIAASLLVLAAGLAQAQEGATGDPQLDQARKELSAKFPQLDPQNVNRGPLKGILEIRQGAMVAYISEDGRYLLQGDLIDLKENRNLTQESAAAGRLALMSDIEGKGILFAPKKTKHTVTVFTDIDCGFCRKLHREIAAYNDQGIAVRYLMYPRSGPETPSWEKAEQVWCSADRQAAITAAKNDQSLPLAKCDASAIQSHFDLGLAVGLTGTPAIVMPNGDLLSGYLSAKSLAARLDSDSSD